MVYDSGHYFETVVEVQCQPVVWHSYRRWCEKSNPGFMQWKEPFTCSRGQAACCKCGELLWLIIGATNRLTLRRCCSRLWRRREGFSMEELKGGRSRARWIMRWVCCVFYVFAVVVCDDWRRRRGDGWRWMWELVDEDTVGAALFVLTLWMLV